MSMFRALRNFVKQFSYNIMKLEENTVKFKCLARETELLRIKVMSDRGEVYTEHSWSTLTSSLFA